jgi:dephospho-CoA kinase
MNAMKTIYFIAGASGSGKSAILDHLKQKLDNSIDVFDFDNIGVPKDADTKWRQQATEQWIKQLVNLDKENVLLGQMVLGEILASPSASKLGKVHFALLDVSDKERINRLKKRNTYGIDQHSLNWASWLRMHHEDPQWQQHVIKDNAWPDMQFSRWDSLNKWKPLASIEILDTTGLSIDQVASLIKDWINSIEQV